MTKIFCSYSIRRHRASKTKRKLNMSFESIDKLNRDFEQSFNNGQIGQAVSTYADDARVFAPDKQIYQGLNQIEKYYAETRNAGNTHVNLTTKQVIQCDSNYFIELRFLLI